jgi:DNA-binding NarL/FixJ family response regulator
MIPTVGALFSAACLGITSGMDTVWNVLRLVANGLGNTEIGVMLGISAHTAKSHVAAVLAKLDARSRTEAVTIGLREGLLPL